MFWAKQSIKYKVNVASIGKFRFDIVVNNQKSFSGTKTIRLDGTDAHKQYRVKEINVND